MLRIYTVAVKGQPVTFRTPYTDEEALNITRQQRSDFAQSLASQRHLSDAQWRWVHKIAVDATAQPVFAEELNLQKVVLMMHFAQRFGELKRPVIRVELEGLPAIRLTLAQAVSRYPGSVNVVLLQDNRWIGRIHKNGSVEPRDMDPQVLEVLKKLQEDPAAVATMHGRRTGNCCFCGRELTQKDSLACGYGPICAEKFGLPHAGMANDENRESMMALLREWLGDKSQDTQASWIYNQLGKIDSTPRPWLKHDDGTYTAELSDFGGTPTDIFGSPVVLSQWTSHSNSEGDVEAWTKVVRNVPHTIFND